MEEKIPDILYHYCSVDTFAKIVQNKTLRMSEIAKSNDSMECKWLERNILPKKIKECAEENLLSKGIKSEAHDDTVMKCLNRYFKYYGDEIDIQTPRLVFATCFSEEGDLLSQWRGYASDGSGVSIGFGKELFNKIKTINQFVHIRKAIYLETEQMNYFNDEINEFVNAIITRNDIASYATLIVLLASITEHAVIMKNPAFAEEKEWRLFTFYREVQNLNDIIGDFKQLGFDRVMDKIDCSVNSNKLVFYHDLLLDLIHGKEQQVDYISEIILGPKCRLSDRDVVLLLENNEWDTSRVRIVKSSATYV